MGSRVEEFKNFKSSKLHVDFLVERQYIASLQEHEVYTLGGITCSKLLRKEQNPTKNHKYKAFGKTPQVLLQLVSETYM